MKRIVIVPCWRLRSSLPDPSQGSAVVFSGTLKTVPLALEAGAAVRVLTCS